MSTQPRDRLLDEMHDIASALYKVGGINKATMRHFDKVCLRPEVPEYDAEKIRALRERCNMSQAYFAATLNASPVTVQKWEHGTKKPGSMAMKLLSVLDRKGVEVLL